MTSGAKGILRAVAGVLIAASGAALAQNVDIPLTNWTVPPYSSAATAGGITAMTDVTQGIGFVGVTPCRLVDTRSGSGFPSGYGPPSLTAGVPRNFDLNSAPHCTGIPANVDAYSLNLTVVNPQGSGFILIYPQGGSQPNVSTLNYSAGQTVANAVIVPAGTSGGVTVVAGVAGTDLLLDINGYFTDEYNSGIRFVAVGNTAGQGAISGTNVSSATGSSGVYGLAGATTPLSLVVAPAHTGVRGDSSAGVGVSGLSRATGVAGSLLDAATPANVLAAGYLGYSVGSYGVYAQGDIGATGMKFFVEPHPTDPKKVIRFVALEGPEAGTYFRGSSRTIGGWATIDVPESFRIVTDPDGLTVQLTPVGSLVQLAVIHKDLDGITVRSSRDVDFDYEVKGVRRSFRRHEAIADGSEFVPPSADARLPGYLPSEARQRLILNGTYRTDGSVNLTTADRLGWTAAWRGTGSGSVTSSQQP